MPRLEIHHSDGNITYADLSQDKPAMIGSGPKCDVVLQGSEVKRIHCRVVWRDDRWRVEVAADAGGIQLGDKVVKAGTIHAGDVLGIGDCRIYFDSTGEEVRLAPSQDRPSLSNLDDDSAASVESQLGHEEWAPVSSPRSQVPQHARDQRSGVRKAWDSIRLKAQEQVRGELDRRPGEERLLSSPLVRWMGVLVLILAVFGAYFFYDYRERTIKKEFDKAHDTMNAENYEAAIQMYLAFQEKYPKHNLASNARVQRALCEVLAGTTATVQLESIKKMIQETAKEPAFPPIVLELGEVIGGIAVKLAETARNNSDQPTLDKVQAALDVLSKDLPGVRLKEETQKKLDDTVEQAREAIQRSNDRTAALETMKESLQANNPFGVYAAREGIVQKYRDLADPNTNDDKDAEIKERMGEAHRLDVELARFEALNRNPPAEARASAIQASTVLIERTDRTGADATGTPGVKFALAGGVCYAHNVTNGKSLWQRPVGLDAHTLPVLLPGTEPNVLVTDARHDELLAVRSQNGQVVWRQPLGEPLEAAPLINRGKIYQPTTKGSLFVIDSATGRLDGRLQFGTQRLITTPVADDSGQHLYLLGEQSVLYVITLENPPKCSSVLYLAHRPDTVFAAPLRMLRYLVLCENDSHDTCQIRVLITSADFATVEELQRLKPKVSGWVHHVPAVWSNRMWVATDIDTVEIYSAGPPEQNAGYKKENAIPATGPAATRPPGHAYPLGYTENDLLVASSTVRHYEFKPEQNTVTLKELPVQLPGWASQPIQQHLKAGRADALFVGRRVPNSPAILFTALDAGTLEVRWEVLLGTGIVSVLPADGSNNELRVLTRSGNTFRITAAALKADGVVDKPVRTIPAGVELSAVFEPIVLRDRSAICTPAGEANRLFVLEPASEPKTRPVELLAPLQASVVGFGEGFLAPCADGRIYLMSPSTGKPLSEPFQPTLDAAQPPQWRGVVLTEKGTIVAADSRGNIYQIELRKEATPNLAARGQTTLPKPVRSQLATARNVVCLVDDDNRLRTLDAEALVPIADAALPAPPSFGPVAAGNHIFVAAGTDELVCINPEGQVAWRNPLKGETLAGPPLVKGDTAYVAMRGGLVRALRLTDASEVWTLDTKKSLAGGPLAVGDQLVVAGDDGSLNVLRTPSPAQ